MHTTDFAVRNYSLATGTSYETLIITRPDIEWLSGRHMSQHWPPSPPATHVRIGPECDILPYKKGIEAAARAAEAECCDRESLVPKECFLEGHASRIPLTDFIWDRHFKGVGVGKGCRSAAMRMTECGVCCDR